MFDEERQRCGEVKSAPYMILSKHFEKSVRGLGVRVLTSFNKVKKGKKEKTQFQDPYKLHMDTVVRTPLAFRL